MILPNLCGTKVAQVAVCNEAQVRVRGLDGAVQSQVVLRWRGGRQVGVAAGGRMRGTARCRRCLPIDSGAARLMPPLPASRACQ